VLDRAFGYQDAARSVPDDFGVELTGANVESHLAATRSQQARYREDHPDDVLEIESILRNWRAEATLSAHTPK
jgi:hypothetical protein